MRVTGSGDPRVPVEKTLHGKLPSRKITTGAAHGYSSYGNQIGLATGQVTELYDPGYVAKRLEIGAVIGASPKANVVRLEPAPGDVIVLLGGATGRDGIGGATGSSKAHTEKSVEVCGAEVQKGNPPTERKIQRLFRDPAVSTLIKRCNDFGAGGVSVAIGELAPGLDIDLDKVPKKYEGHRRHRAGHFREPGAYGRRPCPAGRGGLLCRRRARKPRRYGGSRREGGSPSRYDMARRSCCEPGAFLPRYERRDPDAKVEIAAVDPEKNYRTMVPADLAGKSTAQAFRENLSRLEVCCQKGLAERFDASIGAATVNMPFGGKYQLTPEEAMAAKLPVRHGVTDDATAMSFGYIPGVSRFSPFHGAAWAVVESLSKLCAIGADPLKARLTFQEYFERMTGDPKRWGKPAAALLGALEAQLGLGLPAIGGKDSMSGTFETLDVPPTLVSFAVTMTKASKTRSAAFTKGGSKVWLLPLPENRETLLPDWEKVKEFYRTVLGLMENSAIGAVSVVKEGGAAAAAARMCFGNKIGFAFADCSETELFAPLSGSLVVEASSDLPESLGAILLGETKEEPEVTIGGETMAIDDLLRLWMEPLEKVFPNYAPEVPVERDVPLFTERSQKAPAIKAAKPRVFIPVFPGTNCEYDTARAFEKAGAETEILVVRNLSAAPRSRRRSHAWRRPCAAPRS